MQTKTASSEDNAVLDLTLVNGEVQQDLVLRVSLRRVSERNFNLFCSVDFVGHRPQLYDKDDHANQRNWP